LCAAEINHLEEDVLKNSRPACRKKIKIRGRNRHRPIDCHYGDFKFVAGLVRPIERGICPLIETSA
jgi:hypothetical protein